MVEVKNVFQWIIIFLNIYSYFLVMYDKKQAKKGEWRIPEKRFFLLALFGGGIGVYLGMRSFRHKTKHIKFVLGIPFLIVINLVFFYFAFFR